MQEPQNGDVAARMGGLQSSRLGDSSPSRHVVLRRTAHVLSRVPAMDVQRLLIGFGLLIFVIGIVWPILSCIGLGRLPGDTSSSAMAVHSTSPWLRASLSALCCLRYSGCSTDRTKGGTERIYCRSLK